MNKFLIVAISLAMVLILSQGFEFLEKELESEDSLWSLYERWRSHHTVSRSVEETCKRFNVFKENVKHVHNTNNMDKPYKLGLNKFADMTSHEILSTYAGSKVEHHRMFRGEPKGTGSFMYANVKPDPPSVDWRDRGAVNPVKDQGIINCKGSGWAFSTIAAVEAINQMTTTNLVPLSEQELIDCDYSNQGCKQGLMDNAFHFIKQHGITTEANYPYQGVQGTCKGEKVHAPVVFIDGHENVPKNNEAALRTAVKKHVVSAMIDASSQEFILYSKGVFTGYCGTELNHGVAIVGYDSTDNGTTYWIVRNSWGSDWGEDGYIRIQRDIAEKHGQCGIAMDASYPIIKTSNNPGPAESFCSNDEL